MRNAVCGMRNDKARRSWRALVLLACLLIHHSAFSIQHSRADESNFKADLDALTQHPHRLTGTPEGAAAAAHIEARLKAIDGVEVFPIDMPVWRTHIDRCDVTVDGVTLQLHPLRPNMTVQPVTEGDGGITAPMIYVGRGSPDEYTKRSPAGKIVVLEYDCYENWERAFAMGARAVIFIGSDATPLYPKHTGAPANYPRFYASPELLKQIDLRKDHDSVTLVSRVTWELGVGRNVLAFLPGAEPNFIQTRKEPEMMALAAAYDTYGVAPTRSPGARGAANVAALLQTVEHLAAHRPKRDVLVMFLDADSRMHQGARHVYDAITLKPDSLATLTSAHEDERRYRQEMCDMLAPVDALGDASPSIRASTFTFLKNEAYFIHSDLRQVQMGQRIERDNLKERDPAKAQALTASIDAAEHAILRWDNIRRVLHYQKLDVLRQTMRDIVAAVQTTPTTEQRKAWAQAVAGVGIRYGFESLADDGDLTAAATEARSYLAAIEQLLSVANDRLHARLAELDAQLAQDAQRKALNARVNNRWIVLHVNYNFADAGPSWGVVVGNRINAYFPYKAVGASSDTPGYYGRVLGAMREASAALTPGSGLNLDTLKDTSMGGQFAPGVYATSGYVAGVYGLYNVSLMTGYDSRLRDGHPADTTTALHWQAILQQGRHAATLLKALADTQEISLPRQFSNQSNTKRTDWSNGKSAGDYATLRVTGSLSEDRPAFHSVMAVWPARDLRQVWTTLDQLTASPSFDPLILEKVDMNGRFSLLGLQKEIYNNIYTLGTMFDDRGRVTAITTQKTIYNSATAALRVEQFLGEGFSLAAMPSQRATPDLFKVLRAASDSALPPNRSLVGQNGNFAFFYIAQQDINTGVDRIKLFQPDGPALVNSTRAEPYGAGVTLDELAARPPLSESTARDLWAVNEMRLGMLRSRGVTSEDLELLHSRARRAMEQATSVAQGEDELPAALRKARLVQSAALSTAVYKPLRQSMDDLVHAIVVLLLLAIPFAFAVERLLFCATTIYGRLLGFTSAFLVTFLLLYTMHPGFAIASTPIVIFLAFAILLLSILVIQIIIRKFRTELKAMQGQRVGLHDVEVSRMGTLLAAVSMGMSTMRRRPTRTFLTAITVIMLTFTILSFASFTRKIGVRSIYEGPIGEEASGELIVRKLDYSAMPEHNLDLVRGLEGKDGAVFGQYWLVRRGATDQPYSVARTTAAPESDSSRSAMSLDAVLGLDPEELDRWPLMRQALRGGTDDAANLDALRRGGVFLPSIVIERLGLAIGDPVLLNGKVAFVAGTFDSAALQRLRHLDGQSILPVNFQDPSAQGQQQIGTEDTTANDLVDKDFVHLSADQVAIASSGFVQQQGGQLHAIVMYLGRGIEPLARAEEVARVVPMPLWARGAQGVERMILTTLTEVSGGMALAVPVILGGLIIFGTLLGSITDREKEIYTFSALGLAPGHVGVLFFAEAAVYAVVGGMGGQLLAQIVAQVSSYLAQLGLISPPQINYSSTNSLFAIGIVMATVIISAIYPAIRASRSANPGLARAWKMPTPQGDRFEMTFPFTVSAYDITGVISFLAEHFERHDDAGLGTFAAQNVKLGKTEAQREGGNLYLSADLALAPFDLGVTQAFTLTARPSEIAGVDEVGIVADRTSGANGDWLRANRVFLRDLRKQFLLWRTLSGEMIENYRMNTLTRLGHSGNNGTAAEHATTATTTAES